MVLRIAILTAFDVFTCAFPTPTHVSREIATTPPNNLSPLKIFVQHKQLSSLSARKGVKPQASSGGIGTRIQFQIQIGRSAAVGFPVPGSRFSVFGFRSAMVNIGHWPLEPAQPPSYTAKNGFHSTCQIHVDMQKLLYYNHVSLMFLK